MEPRILKSRFGVLTVQDGDSAVHHRHDILISPDGVVTRREKELSKQLYGTSHKISLAEAEAIIRSGGDHLLIGAGLFGRVTLSDEAAAFLEERNVRVQLAPTPKAIRLWNELSGNVIGLFHITC